MIWIISASKAASIGDADDDRCRESSTTRVPGWRFRLGLWLCPELGGVDVVLRCPAGRPDAHGGPYCQTHGGEARARSEAERDWNWLAPESVGDYGAVLEAGTMSLRSDNAYIVVRPERDRWLAWVGLGSNLVQVPRRDYTGCGRANCRNCHAGKFCGRRRHAFRDRDHALRDATEFWRGRLTDRIEEITIARGGTLAWGVEVTPLADPIVIELAEAENAWNAAQMRERIGSVGIAMMSGVRGTGEAL